MMLNHDGSRRAWLDGLEAMELILTMDDPTSMIYLAILMAEEGTVSTCKALLEAFAGHRLPLRAPAAVEPVDRPRQPLFPQAGGPVDRMSLTQVGRALLD